MENKRKAEQQLPPRKVTLGWVISIWLCLSVGLFLSIWGDPVELVSVSSVFPTAQMPRTSPYCEKWSPRLHPCTCAVP